MSDRDSRAILSSLAGPLSVPDAAVREGQHQQVRARLREFVQKVPARRKRKALLQRVAVVGSASVATLCAALAMGLWPKRGADVAPFKVEQGSSIAIRDEQHGFVTGGLQPAKLRTQYGAEVAVGVDTDIASIASDETHERLLLVKGSVRVHVPKLSAGATFLVQTPDALVIVHGTVFSVTVSGYASTSSTCVAVSEGRVSVERAGTSTLLKGGDQLNCPTTLSGGAPANSAPKVLTSAEPPGSAGVGRPAVLEREPHSLRAPVPAPPVPERSTDSALAEQNALLAAALRAERAGGYAEARAKLQDLLVRFPSSALRSDAQRSLERVERAERRLP